MADAQPVHVMLDLETLGNGNDAAIWSIGAVKFDPYGTELSEGFYVVVNPESSVQYGGKMDVSTVLWWMQPDRLEPRTQLLECKTPLDIATALVGLAQWIDAEPQFVTVWGNGATFDNIVIRSAYKGVGLPMPWSFRGDMCFRTMNKMFPMEGVKVGTRHNALDDARGQALHLQKIMRTHGQLVTTPA